MPGWRSFVGRIDAPHFFGTSLRLSVIGRPPHESLVVDTTVLDRDDGHPRPLRFQAPLPPAPYIFHDREPGVGDVRAMHVVRDAIRQLLLHEIDEALLLDHRRFRDPHADDQP